MLDGSRVMIFHMCKVTLVLLLLAEMLPTGHFAEMDMLWVKWPNTQTLGQIEEGATSLTGVFFWGVAPWAASQGNGPQKERVCLGAALVL
jgi:hypothetical protein